MWGKIENSKILSVVHSKASTYVSRQKEDKEKLVKGTVNQWVKIEFLRMIFPVFKELPQNDSFIVDRIWFIKYFLNHWHEYDYLFQAKNYVMLYG